MNFVRDKNVLYNKGYSDSEYLEFLDSDVSTIESISPPLTSSLVPPLSVSNYQTASVFNIENFGFIWCIDYANDIIESLKEIEKNRRKILYKSPQMNTRLNLVSLIKFTAETLGLGRTTVHLAVYMLDVFMDYYNIIVYKLNAVALVCLLLASKMEECDYKIPRFDCLTAMVEEDYNKNDFKVIETKLLQFFKWYLLFPTGATFLESYVSQVVCIEEFNYYKNENHLKQIDFKTFNEMSANINSLVFEFLDLTLQDRRLVQLLPSLLSAACLAAARIKLGILPIWNDRLANITGYSYEKIDDIVKTLISLKMILEERMKNTPDSGFLSENSESEDEDYRTYISMSCPLPFKRKR